MNVIVEDFYRLNKPLGINEDNYIKSNLSCGFKEVNKQQFKDFINVYNWYRDLVGGISRYYLVGDNKFISFYNSSQTRFFIKPL